MSQHKKSSKYFGSVNCSFLDINREPNGLYFKFGDFWSIIQEEVDDPKFVEEVVRENIVASQLSSRRMSPLNYLRESDDDNLRLSGGATSGLPPVVPANAPLEPNIVYTLPSPPRSVFYSKEVIDRAQHLNLHPRQEYMRYDLAKALSRGQSSKDQSVFSKLKKLGSKKR